MSCSFLNFKMPETYLCMDCSLGHVPKNAVSVGSSLGLEKSYVGFLSFVMSRWTAR